MKIGLNVLDRQFGLYQEEYESAALRVLRSGWYVLGQEVTAFEEEFAKYIGAKYCVGLNSGLDALTLAVRALGIGSGDEVLVPANTYIATVLAITANNATPVFVEPNEYYNIAPDKVEANITSKTKAILVVHLYGQAADMNSITRIANQHHLKLIEDCAQSHGAKFGDTMTGNFGEIGCFSFYPTKNLGTFGDGGAIVTNDENWAHTVKMLRNYGSEVKYHNKLTGVNSRLDEMQAALLRVKLTHIKTLLQERKKIARKYLADIDNPLVKLPQIFSCADHVWHQFVVRTEKRDELQRYLAKNGIQTTIHYPIPPHLAECYTYLLHNRGDFPITERYADEVLSLPMFNGMKDDEIKFVIDVVNGYGK